MIKLENVHFTYPGSEQASLSDLNLLIPKGALLGLIGPNGAGKTTLISLLTARLAPSKGRVSVAGFELPVERKKVKSCIGYIPQDYAFYPQLTLLENLEFFAGIQGLVKGEKKQRIEQCMEFCQLAHMAKQKVQTFSGGLKRRANIAIGLLNDPEILLFDEPTVGIDPQSRAFILKQIKALQAQGKTIIYTSHYMEEVEQLCDHLAIIDQGKILQQGSIDEINQQLQSALQVEFSEPVNQGALKQLVEKFQADIDGNVFTSSHVYDEESFKQFMQQVLAAELQVKRLSYGQHQLEQLFLQMTDRKLRD